MRVLALVVMAAALALAGCGGGNNAGSANKGGGGGGDNAACGGTTKSAADMRQETVDGLVKAFADLDADALKKLWLPEEHELVEKRITKEFPEIKKAGGSWTGKPQPIEEKDGKFILAMEFTVKPTKDAKAETENRSVELVEHDGKWVAKFTK